MMKKVKMTTTTRSSFSELWREIFSPGSTVGSTVAGGFTAEHIAMRQKLAIRVLQDFFHKSKNAEDEEDETVNQLEAALYELDSSDTYDVDLDTTDTDTSDEERLCLYYRLSAIAKGLVRTPGLSIAESLGQDTRNPEGLRPAQEMRIMPLIGRSSRAGESNGNGGQGQALDEIMDLVRAINFVMDAVICDVTFLQKHLTNAAESDPFLRGLLGIMDRCYGTNRDTSSTGSYESKMKRMEQKQPRLHLLRQDYLMNAKDTTRSRNYNQVEINTIAVAFAGMSQTLAEITNATGGEGDESDAARKKFFKAADGYARGLAAAHEAYARRFAQEFQFQDEDAVGAEHGKEEDERSPAVCFLCFENDTLEMDQRRIQQSLKTLFDVPSFFAVLPGDGEGDVADEGALGLAGTEQEVRDDQEIINVQGTTLHLDSYSRLWINHRHVAVVYWHTSFAPENTHSKARELIERSAAIKVPTVPAQLAGTKKIQQCLADEETLMRFLRGYTSSSETREENKETKADNSQLLALARRILDVTATQYDLEEQIETCLSPDADGERARALIGSVYANPEKWLLKPQREGGGNNLFGQDMLDYIKSRGAAASSVSETENAKQNGGAESHAATTTTCPTTNDENYYILMKKIETIPEPNVLFLTDEGASFKADAVTEVGLFSVFFRDPEDIKLEEDSTNSLNKKHFVPPQGEINEMVGIFQRAKRSSSDEGGICAGHGFLDLMDLEEMKPG
ncbi:unnamed protein product [Amoebophrya sp. A25]|nr:unnamed protein product [Amoebophrya sp. A25]|eukprot:GSA25T00014427001.1